MTEIGVALLMGPPMQYSILRRILFRDKTKQSTLYPKPYWSQAINRSTVYPKIEEFGFRL